MARCARIDDDLVICEAHGLAYQRDMTVTVRYDKDYFNKCRGYEDQAIAVEINVGRVAMVNTHVGADSAVCDIGIGSGEFIRKRPNTWGVDVNPAAVEWLKARDRWADDLSAFHAFTFWDVLEHLPDPAVYLDQIGNDGYLFTSVPVFHDLSKIRESKHYRPGEHLYYFTLTGFVAWLGRHGFRLLDHGTFEIDAGRDSIHSFAFRRVARG